MAATFDDTDPGLKPLKEKKVGEQTRRNLRAIKDRYGVLLLALALSSGTGTGGWVLRAILGGEDPRVAELVAKEEKRRESQMQNFERRLGTLERNVLRIGVKMKVSGLETTEVVYDDAEDER